MSHTVHTQMPINSEKSEKLTPMCDLLSTRSRIWPVGIKGKRMVDPLSRILEQAIHRDLFTDACGGLNLNPTAVW